MTTAVPASRLRRAYWLLTAALTGAVAMALEIAAARLLAPHFGSSMYVWGTLISAVLAVMACGYVLGGRLADARHADTSLYAGIAFAGLAIALSLFTADPLLAAVGGWPEFSGTLVATLALIGLPVLLLAGAAPYIIRLTLREERPGTGAGVIYALGTGGSIAGVLFTSFVLLPDLGTRATLATLGWVTLALGALGAFRPRYLPAWLAGAVLLGVAPRPTPIAPAVHLEESIYHTIRVIELGPLRGLVLDSGDLQTLVDTRGGLSNGYWDDFSVGPLLAGGTEVLVLGLGAGASVRATLAAEPQASIEAVELDAAIAALASSHFGLEPGPDLRVHIGDARRFLVATPRRYDVIQADLYHRGPSIPFHLATREFFEVVRAHLEPGGVLMMNVFDVAPERPVLNALAATLAEVFPVLLVSTRQGANHLVLAFPEPRSLGDVRAHLLAGALPPELTEPSARLADSLRLLTAASGAPVLTDDHAPLERLTRAMLDSAYASGVLPTAPRQ